MARPQTGSGAPAATGRVRVTTASAGTQTSAQISSATAALSVTLWPTWAEAGTWIGTGSSTLCS